MCGSEPSRPARAYRRPIAGEPPEPLTPEGVIGWLSPIGDRLLVNDADGTWRRRPCGITPIAAPQTAPVRGRALQIWQRVLCSLWLAMLVIMALAAASHGIVRITGNLYSIGPNGPSAMRTANRELSCPLAMERLASPWDPTPPESIISAVRGAR